MPRIGRVYLVGAGPGEPALLTLRGAECLRRADVVLYDYLVNPRTLSHARPAAELVCLGQHGRTRIWSQQDINERLIAEALQGRTVVRLKGGDPVIFAHATEEIAALQQHAIPFEIVPGVTAGLAAASYAGIPLTDREHASAVALVTGQEDAAKPTSCLDYRSLAAFPGTLVLYMGVTTARQWSQQLLDGGLSSATPVAIVRRCSLPDQQVIRCTLAEVAARIEGPPLLRPPAVAIVGQVVPADTGLTSWFQQRPLFGQRIVVTRPRHQADQLASLLAEAGAEVLFQPAIEISEPADWGPVDEALSRLREFDWVVFSSANGVHYFLQRLFYSGRDVRALGGVQIAAIGPGTASALGEYRLRADLQPDEFRAETLAAALAPQASGRRFLLIRASRGREVLAEQLQAAGAHVQQVVVYRSTDVALPDETVVQQLANREIDWIAVTSSAIARSLVSLFGDQLRHTQLASISPITSATLRECGHEPRAEAKVYTMEGLVDAISGFQSSVELPSTPALRGRGAGGEGRREA